VQLSSVFSQSTARSKEKRGKHPRVGWFCLPSSGKHGFFAQSLHFVNHPEKAEALFMNMLASRAMILPCAISIRRGHNYPIFALYSKPVLSSQRERPNARFDASSAQYFVTKIALRHAFPDILRTKIPAKLDRRNNRLTAFGKLRDFNLRLLKTLKHHHSKKDAGRRVL
jgi:hypothetical protein